MGTINHVFSKIVAGKTADMRLLLILLLSCFSCLHAQNRDPSDFSIVSLTEQFQRLGSGSDEATRLRAMLEDVQPSVYIGDGKMNVYGEAPVCLFIDFQALPSLPQFVIPTSVELVTIRVDSPDTASKIDMSLFSAMPNLRYLYLLSATPRSESVLRTMMTSNATSEYDFQIFYNVVKDM